nr:immunoglobulin light chain junction region [Macaca mulatta]MOW15188.1 immunoglobulin light chain junction region [Macaca mulatta]MOW17582.1 immunoglobulin light chain junction region [Macaca mulatta]MOW18069.1 immunoglobulin light chain junction region [Macaca mulatta]
DYYCQVWDTSDKSAVF